MLQASLKARVARQTARPYSSEMANAMVQVSQVNIDASIIMIYCLHVQNIGMGNAAIGLGGVCIAFADSLITD